LKGLRINMTEKMTLFGKQKEYEAADVLCHGNKIDDKTTAALVSILKIAEQYRLCGNIYKSYIAWLLIHDENPYSLSCEMNNAENGGLRRFALLDAQYLYDMYNAEIPNEIADMLGDFTYTNDFGCENMTDIGNMANELANRLDSTSSAEQFLQAVTQFYCNNGVGMLGLNKAFYIDSTESTKLVPISDFDRYHLTDMWGYEHQKKLLTDNTEAFINGKAANNVLLYGDSGTGKSTSIKAILNEYHTRGLRMIEVYKHQFSCLPRLIEKLRLRRYSFIIYMDDLSFEEFEIEYKFLKAIIEGGLEKKPDNVLIYATSNRRHLIRESFSDRDGNDDIHKNDTVQEKLSLSDRFGLTISFTKPMQKEYLEIVKYLAHNAGINMPEDALCAEASRWGLMHGGVSGRVARQFINHLLGAQDE
ncbi:MAG: ATP-binding protein, partial [Acutalibacteraceae bacterium]|nr:ATP-binding protein [Acutalibacteraceae bacterium]